MDTTPGGSIGTGDAAVLALLADTARAGRGGGWGVGGWGGEGGGYGSAYGNIANAVRLDRNAQQTEDQADCTRNLFGQAFSSIQNAFENGTRDRQQAALSSQITNGEFRISDRLRDTELNSVRESADLARQIAACCCDTQKGFLEQALRQHECCCETQKVVMQENQKTRDQIMDNELRRATDANNINATVGAINGAAAANTAAIIAAIREGHHHPRP